MQTLHRSVNPFVMMKPEVVLRAIALSERLANLNRRICRPLDKPAPTKADATEGSGGKTLLEDESD